MHLVKKGYEGCYTGPEELAGIGACMSTRTVVVVSGLVAKETVYLEKSFVMTN